MKLQWDVFCRVVDNFGDIGVCWRLARDLASRGESVRLWLDDDSALRWMAPTGVPAGITLMPWAASLSEAVVGDVVIESFGCALPDAFVERMAARRPAPVWINLEYLSAEAYVERSHGLASPQFAGPGQGLSKLFFYPGFTPRTGGLLREPALLQEQARFDPAAWLAGFGLQRRPAERIVSLFAYPNPELPALLDALACRPTLLLVCPGALQEQMRTRSFPPGLRWQALPYLSQPEYDHLLWACDLNFVRGEDSFVRAQWAGKPFVWHIYPQQDGAHGAKLEAFLQCWLRDAEPALAAASKALWRAWNGLQPWADTGPNDLAGLAHAQAWRAQLAAQPDLITQLLGRVRKSS